MQFFQRGRAIGFSAVFGLLGLVLAGWVTAAMSQRFESTGTLLLKPWGAGAIESDAMDRLLLKMAADTFEGGRFDEILGRRDIRTNNHRDIAAGSRHKDVDPRGDVRVQLQPPDRIHVSFVSDDATDARQVTVELMSSLIDTALAQQLVDAPASPVTRYTIQIAEQAGVARPTISTRQVVRAGAGGLGGGLLLGAAIAFGRRRRKRQANNHHGDAARD